MFNSFARRISRRIGTVLKFLSPEDADDSLLDNEKNLYKRDIIRAARSLEMFEEDLITPGALAEAIDLIGSLAYTGGPPANKCAGTYIEKFAELLKCAEIRYDIKLAILKSLSTITVNHAEHQNLAFEKGLITIVADIVAKTSEGLQCWAIYCIYCLALDNIRSLQSVKNDITLHGNLQKAAQGAWSGFRHNYADVVLKLAGLEPIGPATRGEMAPEENNEKSPRKHKIGLKSINLQKIVE